MKTNHLPKWFTTEILQARRQRDFNKRKRNWVEYKRYRNMTKSLIRKAKQKHFSDTVTDHRDAKTIWQHIRSVKNKDAGSLNILPDVLNIDDKIITNSHEIASQLNEYFATISKRLNNTESTSISDDILNINHFVRDKVPVNVEFQISHITTSQVSEFINKLDPSKATGLDGVGPRILKLACDVLSPSIALLINKSLQTGQFPNKLKMAKVFPIFKSGNKTDPSNYRPISILPTCQKYLRNM